MKKPLIAIITAVSLLAMLCAGDRATPTAYEGFETARILVPNHNWGLTACASAKAWGAPSLHQSARSKATPARIVATDCANPAGPSGSLAAADTVPPTLLQLPRLISPRAPPQRSISL